MMANLERYVNILACALALFFVVAVAALGLHTPPH